METSVVAWREFGTQRPGLSYLERVLSMLEHRLPHLRGRGECVQAGCQILGAQLKLSAEERFALSLAGQFHDLGMLAVPDDLVLRAGRLSPAEQTRFDAHTSIGGRLLAKVFPDLPEAVEAVWFHHERPDGAGPHGLRDELIHPIAGVVSMVSTVADMSRGGAGRAPMPPEQIAEIVRAQAGARFPQSLVQIFLRRQRDVLAVLARAPMQVFDPRPQGQAKARPAPDAPAMAPPDAPAPAPAAPAMAPPDAPAAPVELAPLFSRRELLRIITERLELRPLEPVAHNVMSLTSSAQCTADDVAKEIIRDQALSIRVLKMSNSSAYARGRAVTGVKSAIARIGLQQIRQLVMTLAVLRQYEGVDQARLNPELFWEHSIACGLIGNALAKACGKPGADDYFLYGMLHDVGRLMLLEHVPEQYGQVWDVAQATGLPLQRVEARMLSMDHCDVLQEALRHWRFPREFIVPAVSHHQSAANVKRLGASFVEGAAIVAVADRLSRALLLGSSGNDVLEPVDELAEMLGMTGPTVAQCIRPIPDETAELKVAMLARSKREDWPDFAMDLRGRLRRELRPLCLSPLGELDVFAHFAMRLGVQRPDEPPNLAVLYLRRAAELDRLNAELVERERQAAAGALPALVICAEPGLDANHPALAGRPRVLLRPPVRIGRMIEAIASILNEMP